MGIQVISTKNSDGLEYFEIYLITYFESVGPPVGISMIRSV